MRSALASVPAALLLTVLAACGTASAPVVPATGPPAPSAASPSAPSPAPSSPTAPATAPASAAGPCRLDGLRAELAAPEGAAAGQGERTVRVVWTNTAARPCTMTGFGGVDVERTSSERAGSAERGLPNRFSVPRGDGTPSPVRLEPGGKAHTTIGYLSDRYSVDDFYAERVLATPPDETRSVVLPWSGDIVLRGRTILEPVAPGAG